ncbi:hypothetical protein ACIKN0_03360 [Pediococcus acidilactici]
MSQNWGRNLKINQLRGLVASLAINPLFNWAEELGCLSVMGLRKQ